MSLPTSSATSLPPRPRLVLRLGFAGRKELSDPEQRIVADSLDLVMQTLAKRLSSIAPSTPAFLPLLTDHCSHGTNLFSHADSPARQEKQWMTRLRKSAWTFFNKRFKNEEEVKSDPKLAPYSDYRQRATALNYHYSAQCLLFGTYANTGLVMSQ